MDIVILLKNFVYIVILIWFWWENAVKLLKLFLIYLKTFFVFKTIYNAATVA